MENRFGRIGALENQRREMDEDAVVRSAYRGFKKRGTIAEKIASGLRSPDRKYISALRGQKKSCDKNSMRYEIISTALGLCEGSISREEGARIYRAVFLK